MQHFLLSWKTFTLRVKPISLNGQVNIQQLGLTTTFCCSLVKPANNSAKRNRPSLQLPFGLQLPKRRRRRRTAALSTDRERTLQLGDSSSSSEESNSSCRTGFEGGGLRSASVGEALVDDVPINTVAEQEAKQAEQLELELLHDAVHQQVPASTFFNKQVGLVGVDFIPASSRGKTAQCFYCNQRVDKGQVRYHFAFNIRRPWRYVHPDCVQMCIQDYPDGQAQALGFLLDAQHKYNNQVEIMTSVRELLSHLSLDRSRSTSSSSGKR